MDNAIIRGRLRGILRAKHLLQTDQLTGTICHFEKDETQLLRKRYQPNPWHLDMHKTEPLRGET